MLRLQIIVLFSCIFSPFLSGQGTNLAAKPAGDTLFVKSKKNLTHKSAWSTPQYVEIPSVTAQKTPPQVKVPSKKRTADDNQKPRTSPDQSPFPSLTPEEEVHIAQALDSIFAAAALNGEDGLFNDLFNNPS